jgi:hypothetical protein
MGLEISIDPAQLAMLRRSLNAAHYRQAIFQVVKRTTVALAKNVRQLVQDQTNLDDKYAARVISSKPPVGEPPVGHVIIQKKGIPLIAFDPRVNADGVSVQLAKK